LRSYYNYSGQHEIKEVLMYLETCSMASRKKTSFISFEEPMLKSSRYCIRKTEMEAE